MVATRFGRTTSRRRRLDSSQAFILLSVLVILASQSSTLPNNSPVHVADPQHVVLAAKLSNSSTFSSQQQQQASPSEPAAHLNTAAVKEVIGNKLVASQEVQIPAQRDGDGGDGVVVASMSDNSKQVQIIEQIEEAELSMVSHHSQHSSTFDVITLAVALVMAVLVLPLALAYRLSANFRNAIAAISAKQQGSSSFRAGKQKRGNSADSDDREKMLSPSSSASSASISSAGTYHPKLVSLAPTASTFRSILSPQDVQNLVPHLPYHLTAKDWQLLYASELHGYSLHSAYRRTSAMNGPCVIAAMDMNRSVFVAFCSETLKPNGTNYFGNGECWVASVSPHFQVSKWKPGNNEQFVLASDSFLGFGGGGTFALWFDAQFERGTSEPNSTFGNTTFLASEQTFKLASVEIWGFASPSLRTSLGSKAFKTVTSVMGRIASKASNSWVNAKE